MGPGRAGGEPSTLDLHSTQAPRPERQPGPTLRPEAPWPNAKPKGARLSPRALRVCPADPKVCPERLSPPEVPASPAAAQPGSPRPALPLMDLVLPGVLYADELRGHWVPRFRHGLGFSPWPSRSLFVCRPLHLSMKFHPPASFPPPAESCGLRAALRAWSNLATRPNSRRAPPMGSSSLIATSAGGVHHSAGNPDPAVKFRPRRFSRPRRFPPPPAFAGLFHPAATSRVCPSGDCPSPRSRTGFPRPRHALLPLSAAACDQRPRPRLQGLAPRCECGVGRDGLGLDRSAPLMGFSSPGYSPRTTWECLRIPYALGLHREEPLAAGPRRLAVARVGLPGIRLPTRSSFPA